MASNQSGGTKSGTTLGANRQWLVLAAVLGGALAVMFFQSFEPGHLVFANDGSMGSMKTANNRLPGRFTGTWQCISWLGIQAPAASPSFSAMLGMIFPPEIFLKFYAPLTLLFVGFAAFLFFRQLEFNPMVCVLGGVAAGLNMHFFSVACWGLGSWEVSVGMIFLALAALSAKSIRQTWAKAVLAGLAVGLNLMEGFDSGAILSLYLGAYVIFRSFNQPVSPVKRVLTAAGSAGLVVLFSAIMGAHTLSSLVETQTKDVARLSDETPMENRWDFSTQWSLPKLETLRVIIPGAFGYRMTQFISKPDKSSAYWGLVGQDPRIEEMRSDNPQTRARAVAGLQVHDDEREGLKSDDIHVRTAAADAIRARVSMRARHSGSGEFAGVLVSILAIFALSACWRGGNSPYSVWERRAVWFWALAALFSLMAAWGRHGLIYRALYQLPFFSSIRNPVKFMHPFHLAWVVLATYGLEVFYRRYISVSTRRTEMVLQHVILWFKKSSGFEKKWTIALMISLGVSLAALVALAANSTALAEYIEMQGFSPKVAPRIASFTLNEGLWFVVFLALSIAVVVGILSGAWSGPRAKSAWVYLAAIIVLDLARSDYRWISYVDYRTTYASNSIFDFLAEKPYEHRVVGRLSPIGPYNISGNGFNLLYHFWLQNDFPYHNIQALDVAQWPRMPLMDSNYLGNFLGTGTNMTSADLRRPVRMFQLTNTRFILAYASTAGLLDSRGGGEQSSFQIRSRLGIVPKPGVTQPQDYGEMTVEANENGQFALIEYTNALPRAKLYANWKPIDDDATTLQTLASPEFDPWKTVLVAKETLPQQASSDSQTDPGTVTITDYRPKYVQLKADARAPAILLLNDRVAPDWKLSVDQKPASILRCNYIMRGVFLPPGEHTVEFRFQPPVGSLYVSLGAWVVGILVGAYVIISRKRNLPIPAS